MTPDMQACLAKSYKADTVFRPELLKFYIGGVSMVHRPITNAVRMAYGAPPLRSFTVYYYGKPDAELCELFGIKPVKKGR